MIFFHVYLVWFSLCFSFCVFFLYLRKSENIHNTLCFLRVYLCVYKYTGGKFNGFFSFSVHCCTCVTSKITAISNLQNELQNSNISIFFYPYTTFNPSWWTNINNTYAYRVKFLLPVQRKSLLSFFLFYTLMCESKNSL